MRLLLPIAPLAAALCAVTVAACAAPSAPQPVAQPAPAAMDASAQRGLDYARSFCGACHAVEGGTAASPNPDAPTFAVIARMPGMSPTTLNVWMHSAHPTMPNLAVPPDDLRDLAAYLHALEKGDHGG